MQLEVTQKVSKEAYEFAHGLAQVAKAVKVALQDGLQPGQDFSAIGAAVVADLFPAVQGMDKLGEEKTEDVEAFVTAFLIPMKELAFELVKKG